MIDVTRFSSGMKCMRRPKSEIQVEETVYFHKKTGKRFHPSQVILEDDTYYYFTPIHMETAAPAVFSADATWNTAAAFSLAAARVAGGDTTTLGYRQMAAEAQMSDLEAVLDVCLSMGRLDVAWELVKRHLDLKTVPTSWVVWSKFPHKSDLTLRTGPATAVALTGTTRKVVEAVWAMSGGWHGDKMYEMGYAAFEQYMGSMLNPFMLANVHMAPVTIGRALHAPYDPPGPMKVPEGRKYWVYKGIMYLADVDGSVLPFWFTDETGPEPEVIAWGADFRRTMAAKMGMPLNVARKMLS